MRANKSMQWMFLAAALLALPSWAIAQQGEVQVGKVTGHSGAGKQLYYRFCWGCHGFRGDGNGENGPYLNILPRNFVAATFKCRSTPTGTLPTDEDLYNSLGRGFNNSNMPGWISLTKQQRADMVAFIKTFSPRWKSDKPGDPIAVPTEPALSLQSIQHGKERSEEHTSELQSRLHLVCRLLLEKKKKSNKPLSSSAPRTQPQ